MMSFAEYVAYRRKCMTKWQRFALYATGSPPSFRCDYLEYALDKILCDSQSHEEAKEMADKALFRLEK